MPKIKIVKFHTDSTRDEYYEGDDWASLVAKEDESTPWEEMSEDDYQNLLSILEAYRRTRGVHNPQYAVVLLQNHTQTDDGEPIVPTIDYYKNLWQQTANKIAEMQAKTAAKTAATRAKNKEAKERKMFEELNVKYGSPVCQLSSKPYGVVGE